MSRLIWNCGIPAGPFWPLAASLALMVSAPSCNKSQVATQTAQTQAAQKTFASPDDAGAALLAAAQSGNQDTLIALFGPGSKDVLLTGDSQGDATRLKNFVDAYNQMHRWTGIKAGGEVLQVGADNSSFPIPLGQNSAGRWYFDTAAGKDEILARRVGKNELTAMDASRAIANAQQRYHQAAHDGEKTKEYAQKFVSDPGKHNGLYWPAAQGQPTSPLGQLSDFTTVLSSAGSEAKPLPFEGYYYRILTKSAAPGRGFEILAYPAEYRNTGIMTFVIGDDGALYQKDLGQETPGIASAMTEVNPADGWTALPIQTAAATPAR